MSLYESEGRRKGKSGLAWAWTEENGRLTGRMGMLRLDLRTIWI